MEQMTPAQMEGALSSTSTTLFNLGLTVPYQGTHFFWTRFTKPFERSLELPQDIFDNFIKASDGIWDSNLGDITYPASKPPTGNLTVTLSNGFETTIPAEELFVYPRLFDNNGVYSISNNSILIAELVNGTDPQYVVSWGIPYLTMNYLIADWTRNQFSLTPAFRGQQSVDEVLLKAVCDLHDNITTTSVPTSTPTATSSPVTTPVTPVHHKSNTGAIAGGVVGGVAALLLIAGILAFVILRRRRRAQTARTQVAQAETTQRGAPPDRMSQYTQYTGTTHAADLKEMDAMSKDTPVVTQWHSPKAEESLVSPTLSAPLEMPAHPYDDFESHGSEPHSSEPRHNP